MDIRRAGSVNRMFCTSMAGKDISRMITLYFFVFISFTTHQIQAQQSRVQCTDRFTGRPQRCIPPFVNAAFKVPVEATNTCGLLEATEYCLQTGATRASKSCEVCDARDPKRSHPAAFLTDFNNNDNMTWWQSQTMLEDIQYPYSVNLTLNLGKSYDITYVRLKFHSSRPESFAIYKRTKEDGPWIPYQFYSASCEDTYGRRTSEIIVKSDETIAICTDEFSDISPLTGGSVAFSTLEGRPGAYDFENNPVLQEFVTATSIKIVLNRLNTFGDEVFGDPNVLKSYFYGISDFAVGGRCKCNGHASQCVASVGQGLEERLVCECKHDTAGPDCGECLPSHNDRPWGRATATEANECLPCNCNGLSNRCYFDEDMYQQIGHGGHCLECRENTAGVNCERCKDNFFRSSERDRCEDCRCSPVGSESTQCDTSGRCRCKPGVTGEKCDRCAPNYFDFGSNGCRPCACEVAGSLNNDPRCVPDTGICTCKEHVEGQNCDRCQPGYFNLNEDNPLGCMPCFCYGHSSICTSASGYTAKLIQSEFNSGQQRWTAVDSELNEVAVQFNAAVENIGVSAADDRPVFFSAPSRYLGDQRFSYNQLFEFSLRVGEEGARASILDVSIEGNGIQVSAPIFAQGNQVPRTIDQDYQFRLNEHSTYQWSPQVDGMEFMKMLANVTAFKIRGTYTGQGVGFIDNVKLHSARQGGGSGFEQVAHVEQCTCPEGYVGQFCESCAPGYRRDPPNGGNYARCVPCNCNGHSDACDVDTGRCICRDNTVGDNCERCAPGFYGYALTGTPDDCTRCPCPDGGECVEMLNGEVACINCKEGYTGNRCEMCADGYFGDPQGVNGIPLPCRKCSCNDNIDPNAVGNCNTTTGECLKCIYNTGGYYCDECLTGYYGDALDLPKGQCIACNCQPSGSVSRPGQEAIPCDQQTGQCQCNRNVEGKQCDSCTDGYWNLDSGNGCELCYCDLTGSANRTCDVTSGQCNCHSGISGRTCDQCERYHYGFSRDGCKACECDPEGSYDLQCDERSGQCPCKADIEGNRCDRCVENKFNITVGCIDCPPCYSLVQERVNIHRRKLNELREIIVNIGNNPTEINDTDFRNRLIKVNKTVHDLWEDAKGAVGGEGPVGDQLEAVRLAIMDVMMQCGIISEEIGSANVASDRSLIDIDAAERAIEEAEKALRDAEDYIENEGKTALLEAKEAQERLGQQSQRMTDIAKEARDLAEQHEKDAEAIEKIANEALDTSKKAFDVARDAMDKPMETMDAIDDLKRTVEDGESLYDQTKAIGEEAREKAQDAYQNSLGIYTEAEGIVVPEIDSDTLIDDAAQIKDEAGQIKEEADRLMEQQRDLMLDVDRQKQDAEALLDDGIRQQQLVDELLADADVAKTIASEAVAKAEMTLKEANDTLKTLMEFDQQVKESKTEAEESLKKVPQIEDQIEDAEDKTRDAQDNLQGAEQDADDARDLARQAKDTAEMASDDAGRIRQEADDTKQRANEAKDKANKLMDDTSDAKLRLEELEKQAAEDERLAREALAKSDQAKTSALDSSNKVSTALDTVNDILQQLADLDHIDTDKLDAFEQNLNNAEQQLIDADIDIKYNNLIEARQQQVLWLRDYTEELFTLRLDVENVRVINATIPRTCFQQSVLEPTDPTG